MLVFSNLQMFSQMLNFSNFQFLLQYYSNFKKLQWSQLLINYYHYGHKWTKIPLFKLIESFLTVIKRLIKNTKVNLISTIISVPFLYWHLLFLLWYCYNSFFSNVWYSRMSMLCETKNFLKNIKKSKVIFFIEYVLDKVIYWNETSRVHFDLDGKYKFYNPINTLQIL